MKPFLKHSGGKAREIKNFLSHIPNNFNRYIEPFVGGGAVFWYLEPKSAIINDLNKNLIECYKSVKFDYNTISSELDELVKNYSVDLHHTKFYELRDMFNGIRDREYSQGTLYYYINKLVVSGLMRYNSKGYLNTPYSHNSTFSRKVLTKKHSDLLQNTEIYNLDYKSLFDLIKPNKDDFIFLDPPYVDTNNNVYGNDDKSIFDNNSQKELSEFFKSTSAKCLLIINDCDIIQELYKNYIVDSYDKNYSINIKGRQVTKGSKHLIIKNY